MLLTISINILIALHVLVSLLIILVTLMQRPKSEGLGAAFGGGMTENMFGAQTTNVLANFTRYMGGIFFALTLILSVLYAKQSSRKSTILEQLTHAPKPPAAAVVKPDAALKTAPAKQEQKPAAEKPAPAAEQTKPKAKKDVAAPFNNEANASPAAPEKTAPQAPK